MGYSTHYSAIEILDDPDGYWDSGLAERAEAAYDAYDYDRVALMLLHNDDLDSMKWYEHEEDMAKLSAEYPSALFELSGEGEEAGDIWTLWARNGKTVKAKAKIVIEKPDLDRALPAPDPAALARARAEKDMAARELAARREMEAEAERLARIEELRAQKERIETELAGL